jgi:hypothetical protein
MNNLPSFFEDGNSTTTTATRKCLLLFFSKFSHFIRMIYWFSLLTIAAQSGDTTTSDFTEEG